MSTPYLTRTDLRALLDAHGLGPSRALGQNFLCDGGTIDKIVRLAAIEPGDRVVEIGAGLGSLTVGLLHAGAHVTALEIDRYLIPALTETVAGRGEVVIHQVDALEADWDVLLAVDHADDGLPPWKVVANLPYNIATPLLLDLLSTQPRLERFLVMVQREAGERLAAGPGSKTYGIPSVLAAYWADVRLVGTVRAELFLPRPKVASVLVELVRRPTPPVDVDFDALAALVRAGFGQRRKMLRRALADHVSAEQFEAAGVAPTARAEELELEAWGALVRVTS